MVRTMCVQHSSIPTNILRTLRSVDVGAPRGINFLWYREVGYKRSIDPGFSFAFDEWDACTFEVEVSAELS